MQTSDTQGLVGVDWGSTHRRAYAMDAQGRCVADLADDQGALACRGRFAPALQAALHQLNAAPARVLLSGMVGSALGWHVVPYVDGSVPLEALTQHLLVVPDAVRNAACAIVPGYCVRNAAGQPDVMRGEETQLLGAVAQGQRSGCFVLPGTHSKWVTLNDGHISQLRTYMTGELFALLSQHGTLAAASGQAAQAWDDTAFAEGVRSAGQGSLSQQLFGCRARVVCGDRPASSALPYLSGLLIGSELWDALRDPRSGAAQGGIQLICTPELARHYQTAAALLGLLTE